MTDDRAIAAALPDVIEEVFDGEAVLVQLRTGLYYAMNPVGTALWRLLADGRRPAAVAAATGRAPEELVAFAARLLEEELAVPAELDAGPLAPAEVPDGAPTLQRFDDMQDLLLLDPIHDLDAVTLDDAGWPVALEGPRSEPAA